MCCQSRPVTVMKQYGSRLCAHPPLSSHAPRLMDGCSFRPAQWNKDPSRFGFAPPRLFALRIRGRETLRCSVGHLSIDKYRRVGCRCLSSAFSRDWLAAPRAASLARPCIHYARARIKKRRADRGLQLTFGWWTEKINPILPVTKMDISRNLFQWQNI